LGTRASDPAVALTKLIATKFELPAEPSFLQAAVKRMLVAAMRIYSFFHNLIFFKYFFGNLLLL